MQRSRTPPNTYRSEPYSDHSQKCSRTISVTQRGLNRLPQKRISESAERVSREVSPKRNKLSNNRNLQEIRRANTADEKRIVEKKVSFLFKNIIIQYIHILYRKIYECPRKSK